MSVLIAGLILLVFTACLSSGLLFLPAAAIAESLSPRRPGRESLIWFLALGLPHVLAPIALVYALRLHALDPVPWALRNARVRHLCFWPLAQSPDAAYRMRALGLVAALAVLAGLFRPVFALVLSWRQARALAAASTDVPELGVHLTPLKTPWSVCAGFLRSRVYITQGLVQLLTASELEAVIAHETAHAERRDNLRLLGAQVLFGPTILMPTAHYAYRRLRDTLERAADLRALREGPEAEALASALVTAGRKLREFAPPAEERGLRARLAIRHREEFVAERARRVLEARSEEGSAPRRLGLLASTVVLAGLLVASADLIKPSVRCLFESVLAALSGRV